MWHDAAFDKVKLPKGELFDHEKVLHEWRGGGRSSMATFTAKVGNPKFVKAGKPYAVADGIEEWLTHYKVKGDYPNLAVLVQIMIVFPSNTADCERGVSLMGRIIKTKKRNRLAQETLSALMIIASHGSKDKLDLKAMISKLRKSHSLSARLI